MADREHPAAPLRRTATGTNRVTGVEIAWLDADGVIEAVNDAWTEFCRANGGDPRRCGVGTSYLAVCDAAAPDPDAARVAAAIRAALGGDLPGPIAIRVSCDSPTEQRSFDVLVGPRFGDDARSSGATVTLSRARRTTARRAATRPASGPFATESTEFVRRVSDAVGADLAMLAVLVDDEQVVITAAVGDVDTADLTLPVALVDSVAGPVLIDGRARVIVVEDDPRPGAVGDIGSMMVAPVDLADGGAGAVVVGRRADRHRFGRHDLERLTACAREAAATVGSDRLRSDPADRRLGSDDSAGLHDRVTDDLFAAGMALQELAQRLDHADERATLVALVDAIDAIIRRIRTSDFDSYRGRAAAADPGTDRPVDLSERDQMP